MTAAPVVCGAPHAAVGIAECRALGPLFCPRPFPGQSRVPSSWLCCAGPSAELAPARLVCGGGPQRLIATFRVMASLARMTRPVGSLSVDAPVGPSLPLCLLAKSPPQHWLASPIHHPPPAPAPGGGPSRQDPAVLVWGLDWSSLAGGQDGQGAHSVDVSVAEASQGHSHWSSPIPVHQPQGGWVLLTHS